MNERTLADALHYALLVIQNYEADMRGGTAVCDASGRMVKVRQAEDGEPSFADLGWCQGEIYRDARKDIARRALGGVPSEVTDLARFRERLRRIATGETADGT